MYTPANCQYSPQFYYKFQVQKSQEQEQKKKKANPSLSMSVKETDHQSDCPSSRS